MMLIRTGHGSRAGETGLEPRYRSAPPLAQETPLKLPVASILEQTVHKRHQAGHSQRAINLDRRKIKRILDQAA